MPENYLPIYKKKFILKNTAVNYTMRQNEKN